MRPMRPMGRGGSTGRALGRLNAPRRSDAFLSGWNPHPLTFQVPHPPHDLREIVWPGGAFGARVRSPNDDLINDAC
jgi:hypothetical protein